MKKMRNALVIAALAYGAYKFYTDENVRKQITDGVTFLVDSALDYVEQSYQQSKEIEAQDKAATDKNARWALAEWNKI